MRALTSVTDTDQPTILVVEDDRSVRQLIVQTLSHNGFAALEAGSGVDGLAAFQAGHGAFNLVIVDMIMPGMSGLDLAAELARRQPNVKILYISGYGDSIAMESIARQWPDFVLLKPFSTWTLVSRVQQLLSPELAAPASR
jgi:two-component system cell cycle sensor histidine kinase/response regulator CckA